MNYLPGFICYFSAIPTTKCYSEATLGEKGLSSVLMRLRIVKERVNGRALTDVLRRRSNGDQARGPHYCGIYH